MTTGRSINRIAVAVLLLGARHTHADIFSTTASVRSNNSLIVEIQVTTDSAAKLVVTYQAPGVEPLVSRLTPVSTTGPTTITVGRLRASTTYTYTVDAIDDHG